jgi:hypothetical protein
MRVEPGIARQIEGQIPMLDRSMVQLAGKGNRHLLAASVGYRKPNRIPVALPWEMRASGCVPKIAEFSYVRFGYCNFLL